MNTIVVVVAIWSTVRFKVGPFFFYKTCHFILKMSETFKYINWIKHIGLLRLIYNKGQAIEAIHTQCHQDIKKQFSIVRIFILTWLFPISALINIINKKLGWGE